MQDSIARDERIGLYYGQIAPAFDTPTLRHRLGHIRDLLRSPHSTLISRKGDRVYRVVTQGLTLAVKSYKVGSPLTDVFARRRGSASRRAWLNAVELASRGIGTPRPVAFLEFWRGSRLWEQYLITVFQEGYPSLRDELIRIYRQDPHAWKLMNLLQTVADATRQLHEAGIRHGDLGNQNILLRKAGDGLWKDVHFIDLTRARFRKGPASIPDRAFDLSRLHLPSDLLRIFKEMYAQGPVPADLDRIEQRLRNRFAWHTKTRKWRHPIRSRKREMKADPAQAYPEAREIWIWDERSGQPINVHNRRDRAQFLTMRQHLQVAGSVLSTAWPAWRAYRALLAQAFARPLEMTGRIGVAVAPQPKTWDRERNYLLGLGSRIPVIARFYHHETAEARNFTASALRELHRAGYPVSIVLAQDRQTARKMADWAHFVGSVLERMNGAVEWVQVGQAINRVKWGIWSPVEYERMLDEVRVVSRGYPGMRFIGPGVIDFEMHHLANALRHVPRGFHFDGLAHLMYVDRRGAPENRQGPFSTVEKLALARAIARACRTCDDRLLITEVNWPLIDGGVYSPVGSPYLNPQQTLSSPPSATEEDYAHYLVRYLLLALCSGMAERVYWWRLVARGYGLIDDRDPAAWRIRPAYTALQTLLREAGTAVYERRDGAAYTFRRHSGDRLIIDTSSGAPDYRSA